MRIISGEAKGRVLKTRDGKGTRPTDARAREMLFNILGARVVGARFLDLYAGTGSVGLEALSRGASSCIFVEQNAVACAAIRQNIKMCGWNGRAQVWQSNVKTALKTLGDDGKSFEIVFADPPFGRPTELPELCARLDTVPRLLHNEEGHGAGQDDGAGASIGASVLVIQHHWKARPVFGLPLMPHDAADWPESPYAATQERRAGESVLSFFHLK